ncbi:MAG: hypothetical protein JWQ03_1670 [Variovorax sp.]|nr:hypothetical protein [Variovorax sp.]
MADWWQPTAQGYFSRVSKARAREAVKEATGNGATRVAAGMKKGEVTAYCAQLLQDVRWVPAPLRVMAAKGAPAMEEESGAAGD